MVRGKEVFCLLREITNDVISSGVGCHVGGMPARIVMYADDLVLLAPTWHAQQKLLNICTESVTRIGVMFNATKSVTIIFAPHKTVRHVLFSFPSFNLNECLLAVVENCKCLGHILSSVSDDNPDINRQISFLYSRANVLIRKFSRCSGDVCFVLIACRSMVLNYGTVFTILY